MNSLIPVSTTVLGPAAADAGGPVVGLAAGGKLWGVTWTDPRGQSRHATAALAGGSWSISASGGIAAVKQNPDGAPLLPERTLAWSTQGNVIVALRAGRRVPGVRPEFPGAGLVISLRVKDAWQDVAMAVDIPDREIVAASLDVADGHLLAAFLVPDRGGAVVCRALRLALAAVRSRTDVWRTMPEYPLAPGVAGVLAGAHEGVLIAAGGANFPDRPPWEGGVKKTCDEIFVLRAGATAWQPAGRLPEPRGYAAMVSVPGGVLAVGGENASGLFSDSLLLRWTGKEVEVQRAPSLPVALANPVAACLEGKVYVAGGYRAGPPRVSTDGFFCLDLTDSTAGWERLTTWPGPPRAQGVMAALDGAIYLVSGLELGAVSDGKPQTTYLTDAYRYRPGDGWEKLPDLPWSVLAAPSPAPVTASPARVFLLGGVDGRQAGRLPRDTRVPGDILYFDVDRHEWCLWPESWPAPVVTAPAIPLANEWIFVSGETMAGQRTTTVTGWKPGV